MGTTVGRRPRDWIFLVVSLSSHRLGLRLLGAVVITSMCIGVLSAALQLRADFRDGAQAIDNALQQIERSSTPSLANSLLSHDTTQTRLLLEGLTRQTDVEQVELRTANGQQLSMGSPQAKRPLTREFTLRGPAPDHAVLGTLAVHASQDALYDRLTSRAYALLLTESAKALAASLVLLYIFNVWITRPLRQMARHVNALRLDGLEKRLTLARPDDTEADELGQVAAALNRMSQALADELRHRDTAEQDRVRLFDAYERSRWLLQAVIDNTPALVLVRDLQGRYLLMNRRYRDTFTDGRDLIGQTVNDVFSPDDAATLTLADKRALASQAFTESEIDLPLADGMHTYLSLRFPLRDDNGQLFAVGCVASDITERKRAEEHIRHLAQHDTLTGLPNRELLHDRIHQAIVQARRNREVVAVIFIDLDHFKNINDSLGHAIGDKLLQSVAERLTHCLRQGDSVARQGGDEFVVCLPVLHDPAVAIQVADKLLDSLRQPFHINENELHVRASLGISLFPGDGDTAEELLRAADSAMYLAKEQGRDTCRFYTAALNEAAQRRLLIANRLFPALQRDEFVLHYQPQVDIETGRIVGAEALIRWPQSDGRLIGPNEFIHVAEDVGLIGALGEWTLHQACAQAARWRAQGHVGLTMAVNLSPVQMLKPGLVAMVRAALAEHALPAAALELEITEGVLMARGGDNLATLMALAQMGVQLALDDFGTGYSSLAYLNRYPVHVLKIDRSFVMGIGQPANDNTIVSAVIAMAHGLRLQVIAEGVETAVQASFLQSRGCLKLQGHLYSPAVAPPAFDALLARMNRQTSDMRAAS